MKNTQRTCYVTGSDQVNPYYFGSTGHINLLLTQMAFSYFNIRAEKDATHNQIMGDIKAKVEQIEKFSADMQAQSEEHPLDDDQFIDASIQLNIYQDDLAKLVTQKAESGLRILRKMRADYKAIGKLTI